MSEASRIRELLKQLQTLVESNITEDGQCLFDTSRAMIALEYTIAEISRGVIKEAKGTD